MKEHGTLYPFSLNEDSICVNIGVYLTKSTAGEDIVIVMCLSPTTVSNAMDLVGVGTFVIGSVNMYDDSILLAGCPNRWILPVASTVL